MNKAFSTSVCIVFLTLFAISANAAIEWKVKNDLDRDFILEMKLDGDNTDKYLLKVDQTQTILLDKDPHVFWTSLAEAPEGRSQRMIHRPQELTALAAAGVTRLGQIRSPLEVNRGGEIIYKAMTDFPASRNYDALLDELRHSHWKGTFEHNFNGGKGYLSLNGENGVADDTTTLTNIKYVPSDEMIFIVGQWQHRGATGDVILEVAADQPRRLTAYFRYTGRNWISGVATRPSGPPGMFRVTVTRDSAEIKLPGKLMAKVSRGQRLAVHKSDGSWYWVSFPGGKPFGFIRSRSVERN